MLNLSGSQHFTTFYPLLNGEYPRLMQLVTPPPSAIHINTRGCEEPLSDGAMRAIDEAARRIAQHYAKGGVH